MPRLAYHHGYLEQSLTDRAAAPGKNVKQKARLNRSILAIGWVQFEQMLTYKCLAVIKVPAAYTSHQCNVCVHTDKANRPIQRNFRCVACDRRVNADYIGSANILASGIGATARGRGGSLATPMIREIDTRRPPNGYSRT